MPYITSYVYGEIKEAINEIAGWIVYLEETKDIQRATDEIKSQIDYLREDILND